MRQHIRYMIRSSISRCDWVAVVANTLWPLAFTTRKIIMATKTLVKARASTAASKKAVKTPIKKIVKRSVKAEAPALKPCKKSFTTTEQNTILATAGDIEVKNVKAVLAKAQALLMSSLKKGGVGKVKFMGMTFAVTHVAAQKMPAVKKGATVKGFGGVEVISPGKAAYIKPARMRMRVRPLKAFKDAVLA